MAGAVASAAALFSFGTFLWLSLYCTAVEPQAVAIRTSVPARPAAHAPGGGAPAQQCRVRGRAARVAALRRQLPARLLQHLLGRGLAHRWRAVRVASPQSTQLRLRLRLRLRLLLRLRLRLRRRHRPRHARRQGGKSNRRPSPPARCLPRDRRCRLLLCLCTVSGVARRRVLPLAEVEVEGACACSSAVGWLRRPRRSLELFRA